MKNMCWSSVCVQGCPRQTKEEYIVIILLVKATRLQKISNTCFRMSSHFVFVQS